MFRVSGFGFRILARNVVQPRRGATRNPELGTYFSPDYLTARNQFRRAAHAAGAALEALALDAHIDCLLQELGTYTPFSVLRALREENRWHHYGAATLEHPAKAALREALCPAAGDWRTRVVRRGVSLLNRVAAWTFRQEPRAVSGER